VPHPSVTTRARCEEGKRHGECDVIHNQPPSRGHPGACINMQGQGGPVTGGKNTATKKVWGVLPKGGWFKKLVPAKKGSSVGVGFTNPSAHERVGKKKKKNLDEDLGH